MRVDNYNKQMEKILSNISKSGEKPKLLLHSCCAPCSSSVIERLKDYFDLTVYFYNPNMDSKKEYDLRAEEQKRLCEEFKVKCVIDAYIPQEFLSAAAGLEDAVEGGARCGKCFFLRLKRTAERAKEGGFDYFTTTLTVSPLKNADRLNAIGKALSEQVGVDFLVSDFKKKNGYMRSIELSKQYGLYRQNYCGCIFSKNSLPNLD